MTFYTMFDNPEGRAFARSSIGRRIVAELQTALDYKAQAMASACKESGNAKCMQAAYDYQNAKDVISALIGARSNNSGSEKEEE